MNYSLLNDKLGNRSSKRLGGRATYAIRKGKKSIAIRYHNTDVLTFNENGTIKVDSGGFMSPTTKERINSYLPPYAPRLYQSNSVWNWHRNGKRPVTFANGDVIGKRGAVIGTGSNSAEVKRVALLCKQINKYAKLCADSLPLNPPSGADCWYCAMKTEAGIPLGDATKNTNHLEEHMKESYVVPSLVYNALIACGYDPQKSFIFSSVFGSGSGGYNWLVKRAVTRYLKAQFGLPGGVLPNTAGRFGMRR